MGESTIATWDVLPVLGFEPDPDELFSDVRPALKFDFGDFKLSAAALTNLHVEEIVLFSGLYSTPRTIASIHFELPRQVESLEQCAAWIVWCLDQQFRVFRPARAADWIDEGRQNRRLLPWVMSQAKYEARPRCLVRREWLRLGFKDLDGHLASFPEIESVSFSFDGTVFRIGCGARTIALSAYGHPWTVRFRVAVQILRELPKRKLMSELVDISIWDSHINLGPWSCEGETENSDVASPLKFQ